VKKLVEVLKSDHIKEFIAEEFGDTVQAAK